MSTCTEVSCLELFNLLQHQKNWPSGGAPAVLDCRDHGNRKRIIRGSLAAGVDGSGSLRLGGDGKHRPRLDRVVCLYHDTPAVLAEHPVCRYLQQDADCKGVLVLGEPFDAFQAAFPFLCCREHSSKAAKRPLMPSCIVPNLLYLGDLSDAAALPRLQEQINVRAAVTALAELPPSLKSSVAESGVEHTWCNVRDVEEADIKRHFATAFECIERCRAAGTAVFVHCSRGVSRSASLCIAYLMKKEGWKAERARAFVEACRPIVLPNEGFWRCLVEYEKEMSGERSGVYAPAPKTKTLDDLEFEMPPDWAAEPTHTNAQLEVRKKGETMETLAVGEHAVYTFGRSLTCDFPLEHASLSRNHAALIHHKNGGLYIVDLKSSHGTVLDGARIRPFEACLLRDGAHLAFGASSRSYHLVGMNAAEQPLRASADVACSSSAAEAAGALVHGPQLPPDQSTSSTTSGAHHEKRKYTPQDARDAKARKRHRALAGPSHKLSENDRVAKFAGSGSGCAGPGFG